MSKREKIGISMMAGIIFFMLLIYKNHKIKPPKKIILCYSPTNIYTLKNAITNKNEFKEINAMKVF